MYAERASNQSISCKLLLMQAHLEAGLAPQHGSTACKILGCLKDEEALQQPEPQAHGQVDLMELSVLIAGMTKSIIICKHM